MNSIWIAKDKYGDLCISSEKPVRNNGCWEMCDGLEISDSDWFPDLTWESEPIELIIKEKAIDALDKVLDNWVHGGDEDCILAEFEEELDKEKED